MFNPLRRCAALATLALATQSVMAQSTPVNDPAQPLAVDQVIHLGTFTLSEAGRLTPVQPNAPGDIIWDNSVTTGFFRGTVGEEVLDEGDLPDGTVVGEFQIGFATDATGDITLRYSFYQNDNFNSVGNLLPTVGGGQATYDIPVTGLTGGGIFAYTLNIVLAADDQFIVTGPDTDMNPGTDWGWGFLAVDTGNATNLGPLITNEGPAPGAPGRADVFDVFTPDVATGTYTGTFFFGGSPFAQFHMLLIEGSNPPAFSKQFTPDLVFSGQASQLSLIIDNSANVVDATALDVTDNLPALLVVASPNNASTTCTGGTITATPGSGVVSYTGGSVSAGATCEVLVDVVPNSNGSFVNTTGNLTSDLGDSGTASATLTAEERPSIAKSFGPNVIFLGQSSTVTLSIDNGAATQALTAISVVDNLPAGLIVANPPNASTTCSGGSIAAVSGGTSVTYSGGGLAGGATCTVSFDVTANATGSLNNTASLGISAGASGSASSSILVEALPVISKAFAPSSLFVGQSSTVTVSIDNSTATQALSGISVIDNLPAELVVATPANASTTCAGGTLSAPDGATSVNYSGGGLAAGSNCTISFDVTAVASGDVVNSVSLSSNAGNSGNASANLRVNPLPTLAKAFNPAFVLVGDVAQVVLTVDNSGSTLPATGLALTDNLPDGMRVATPNGASHSCGAGALNAPSGAVSVDFSGGDVAANSSCTISFDVVVSLEGNLVNTAGPLQSDVGSAGGAATASATLNVQPLIAPINTLSRTSLLLLVLLTAIGGALLLRRQG